MVWWVVRALAPFLSPPRRSLPDDASLSYLDTCRAMTSLSPTKPPPALLSMTKGESLWREMRRRVLRAAGR